MYTMAFENLKCVTWINSVHKWLLSILMKQDRGSRGFDPETVLRCSKIICCSVNVHWWIPVISMRIHMISNFVCGKKCHYGTKLVWGSLLKELEKWKGTADSFPLVFPLLWWMVQALQWFSALQEDFYSWSNLYFSLPRSLQSTKCTVSKVIKVIVVEF